MDEKYIYKDDFVISIYEDVLSGKFKKFPNGFWNCEFGKYYSKVIMSYLFFEKLNWSKQDIKDNLIFDLFKKYKIAGMIKVLYGNSVYKAISELCPNEFMPWELRNTPKRYWCKETGLIALQWLKDKYNYSDIELIQNTTKEFLVANSLGGLVDYCNHSTYEVLKLMYGDCMKPWDMINVPRSYWTLENAIIATKWLIEEHLNWSEKDVKEKISKKVFADAGLRGMLNIRFNDSPYEAINSAYPGIYKAFEFKNKPKFVYSNFRERCI